MKKQITAALLAMLASYASAEGRLLCQPPAIMHDGLMTTQRCTFHGSSLDAAYRAFYRLKAADWKEIGMPARLPANGYRHNEPLPEVNCGNEVGKDGTESTPHIAKPNYETKVRRFAQSATVRSEYIDGCTGSLPPRNPVQAQGQHHPNRLRNPFGIRFGAA